MAHNRTTFTLMAEARRPVLTTPVSPTPSSRDLSFASQSPKEHGGKKRQRRRRRRRVKQNPRLNDLSKKAVRCRKSDVLSTLTPEEEAELRRVFMLLSNYEELRTLLTQIKRVEERRTQLLAFRGLKKKGAQEIFDADGNSMSSEQVGEEIDLLSECRDILEKKKSAVSENGSTQISVNCVVACFEHLGMESKHLQHDAEDMCWEIDEDGDGQLQWHEFKTFYRRCVGDDGQSVPPGFMLYNVVCFLMYDVDYSGTITMDETLEMLYSRWGKEGMANRVEKLFPSSSAPGTELTLSEYLKAMGTHPSLFEDAHNPKPRERA